MDLTLALTIAGLLFAVLALAFAGAAFYRSRHLAATRFVEAAREVVAAAGIHSEPGQGLRVGVVVNPSKPDAAQLVADLRAMCARAAIPEPLFFATTVSDPGAGQARRAIEAGVDVVVAAGGDGTVRSVATTMAGSGVPMAILPVGTGNLFARNLDLPLTSLQDAMTVVISGEDKVIDVGWAKVIDVPVPHPFSAGHSDAGRVGDTQLFLVIAGLGFDAAMVADTGDALKRRVGWLAYFVAGARHMHAHRMRVTIQLDSRRPVTARVRTVMVGNCGKLPGGVILLPDARLDDGVFDVAAIDTRGGLTGWAQLLGEVVLQGAGVQHERGGRLGRIETATARRVRLRVEDGVHAQVDGDLMGRVTELETWVDPGALVVRVPRPASDGPLAVGVVAG